jgi:hypothetical protein
MESQKVTENQRIMLRLIERSADIGEGWRQVNDKLWRHVVEQSHPDLTELDHQNKRVRLTPDAITVLKYAL